MIESTVTSIVYTADGSQRYWTIPFSYLNKTDVKVYIKDAETGTVTQLQYMYDFVIQDSAPLVVGLVDTPAQGDKILITRATPNTQEEDASLHTFTSPDVEDIADKLTMIVQEHGEKLERCLAVSEFSTDTPLDADEYMSAVQGYAQSAADSASEAASSVEAIGDSLEQAEAFAGQASASATAAATSANSAAGSATSANSAKTAAETAASTASGYASTAQTHASTAATAAQTATTKATEAATSATNAAGSATSASGSASTASAKAAEASTYATNASASASAASGHANTASTQATAASNSANAAAASATTASGYKDAAAASATAAAGSASNAADSATAAAASVTAAQAAVTEVQSYRRVDRTYIAGTAVDDYTGSLSVFDLGLGIDLSDYVLDVLVNGKGYQGEKAPVDFTVSGSVVTFVEDVPTGAVVQFRVNASTSVIIAGTVDVDGKISDHNSSTTAHSDIRTAITTAQSAAVSSATASAATDAASKVSAHNSSNTAHSDIRTLIAAKQDALPSGTTGQVLTKTATGVEFADLPVDSALSGSSANPVQNQAVYVALATKQDALSTAQQNAANSGITSAKVSSYDTHIADADIHVTAAQKTAWTAKQDAISDLATIRSNAASGAGAAATISGYGDVVTHNADEFQAAGNYAAASHTHTKSQITDMPTQLSAFTDNLGSSPVHTHSQYLTTVPAATSSTLGGVKLSYDSSTETLTISVS